MNDHFGYSAADRRRRRWIAKMHPTMCGYPPTRIVWEQARTAVAISQDIRAALERCFPGDSDEASEPPKAEVIQ